VDLELNYAPRVSIAHPRYLTFQLTEELVESAKSSGRRNVDLELNYAPRVSTAHPRYLTFQLTEELVESANVLWMPKCGP
jgi:hypothetical protein